jgi:hypothetical protein
MENNVVGSLGGGPVPMVVTYLETSQRWLLVGTVAADGNNAFENG